jgi:hypothetical protein
LSLNPHHDQVPNKCAFCFVELPAFFYPVPFLHAFSTTGSRGMLGNENRMSSHGRLFAVIFGKCAGHPGINKLPRMIRDGIKPFFGNVRPVNGFEFELRSEPGPLQSGKLL